MEAYEGHWHDVRVRKAASLAIDRRSISEADTLGASKPTGNVVPRTFEFALPLEPDPYDPARAKRLLAEAGHGHVRVRQLPGHR
jgi:peptide/nickel transport system substrate-binding protein